MARENVRGRYQGVTKRACSRSVLKCPICLNASVIYRSVRTKEKGHYQAGHIKDLWCHVCKAETKHIQLPASEAKYNY